MADEKRNMLKTKKLLMKIKTHDMHTGGEPVRIVVSGMPRLEGRNILEKRDYAENFLDGYRELIMNEPRGHKDMYGAILSQDRAYGNEFDVIFIHNEGYSTMCGHAIIALGRYVVDKGLVKPTSPETDLVFNCPCGLVRTRVEYNNNMSGNVTFESVPAFVYKLGFELNVPGLGIMKIDIAYGGAFYAIITDKEIGLDLKSSSISDIIKYSSLISESVKKQLPILHPRDEDLSFLYGTIVTDGKDKGEEGPSTNVCVFADKQVDRSPTGSGVTARMALLFKKGLISVNETKEFKSIIGTTFVGKVVKETTFINTEAVVVEVSGIAYHTGSHTFYLEEGDSLETGFQLER